METYIISLYTDKQIIFFGRLLTFVYTTTQRKNRTANTSLVIDNYDVWIPQV